MFVQGLIGTTSDPLLLLALTGLDLPGKLQPHCLLLRSSFTALIGRRLGGDQSAWLHQIKIVKSMFLRYQFGYAVDFT
jgi:hypothetical protein